MSNPKQVDYGLLIERGDRFDTKRVHVRIVRVEPGSEHPLGIGSWQHDLPKWLQQFSLDGLGIYGFVSDTSGDYIGFEPEYRDLFAIDRSSIDRMAKTLKRVYRQIERDKARQPGDYFVSLARALRLGFYCRRVGKSNGSSYADNRWVFGTINDGRNVFRDQINEAISEFNTERKGAA